MNQSENINALLASLAKAQGEIQGAVKCKINPFHKSKYADLASVWDACRGPLSKNGLSIIQNVVDIEGKSYLCTILGHSSGQWMKSNMPLMISKNDSQAMGSALTYARRYSLAAMVGIVGEDEDDDAEANMKIQREIDTKKQQDEYANQDLKRKEEIKHFYLKHKDLGKDLKDYISEICKNYNWTEHCAITKFSESNGKGIQNFNLWKEEKDKEKNNT